ncbi:MAG: glycosyltransferase [Gemmatimonadota bacterium]|nr:glycosyltransferase [Gemmatimonadota bacterium]
MEHRAGDGWTDSVTRIAFGCFEVPGWGGLTTATYRLFETMLADGLDVHYVNLILEEELPRFQRMLGVNSENPRELPNVHSCYLRAALHEPHPEIASLIDDVSPDRMVGVGDIASLLMKRASPDRELVFLTSGCMQVNRVVPFTEQWAAMNGSARPATPDWKELEAVGMSDLVLTHSPIIQDLFRRFYPDQARKIHPAVFWFAEWIRQDAVEHSALALPFEKRGIDALFIASSWTRLEKNYALVADIVSRLPGLSNHVVGEFAEPIPSATHHGFVGTRADLFRLMGRARTVVCPSSFDAAPGVLFEGSAMGCNVVTSKNCGNWDLCNDRLLVREYTADAFAEAIRRARAAKLPDNMDYFLARGSYRSLKDVLLQHDVRFTAWAP